MIRRQIAHERELPPPYSPENSTGSLFRFFLGRLRKDESVDDGTHDVFSEAASESQSQSGDNTSEVATTNVSSTASDIEMREVTFDGVRPISISNSPARTYLSFSALSSGS